MTYWRFRAWAICGELVCPKSFRIRATFLDSRSDGVKSLLGILQLGAALIPLRSELLQLSVKRTGQARRGGENAFRPVVDTTVQFCRSLSDSIRIQRLVLRVLSLPLPECVPQPIQILW